MSKTKRNFGITDVDGETHIDLTDELHQWCRINRVKLHHLIGWINILRSHSKVRARYLPYCLRTTDTNVKIVVVEEIKAKEAYELGEKFTNWFLKEMDDQLITMRFLSQGSKDMGYA